MSLLIAKICNIPKDFNASGTKSFNQLLDESGYYNNREALTKESIIEYLKNNPEMVVDWENYSSDKRTSEGWYFKIENDEPIVGYYNNIKRFKSKIVACAEFIINEIQT